MVIEIYPRFLRPFVLGTQDAGIELYTASGSRSWGGLSVRFAKEKTEIRNPVSSGAPGEIIYFAKRAVHHMASKANASKAINQNSDNRSSGSVTGRKIETTRVSPGFDSAISLRSCGLVLVALSFCLTQGFAKENVSNAASPVQTGEAPEVAISALETRAAYYIAFREDIALVTGLTLSSSADTRLAHERLAAHDPELLSSGWVAYAALIAADTPAFSEAIEYQFLKKKRAALFLEEFSANPSMVLSLPGANEAIDAILRIAGHDAHLIDEAGEGVIKNAKSLYKQSWASRKISDGTSRVEKAAGFALSRVVAPPPTFSPIRKEKGVLSPNLAEAPPSWTPDWVSPTTVFSGATASQAVLPLSSPSGAEQPISDRGSDLAKNTAKSSPVTTRALVLAAKYATGRLTPGLVNAYAKGSNSSRCVKMAQLNFAQCIAATRTPYEETFCIGKHGMQEMSECIGWIADEGS